MARTISTMLPLGTKAPKFNLINVVDQKEYSLDDLKSEKATVIMFICNHCPFVIHMLTELVNLANNYLPKSISFVAISSNDKEKYPQDGPDKMKELTVQYKFPFPYLSDETQNVAKAYQAVCTPEFYIFDKDLELVYRGRFDDSRPENDFPITGYDLRNALENILAGTPVNPIQKPSIGCNIKWK
ncbi:MAG: thioredoxin family protein [Calditrichaeota bacterium]|nr:MAG: thioredoxin family protein [Calditrichota bacterium]MBL1205747.1 thioredoxin family protein [Calditrichota bacterium]NOG45575.1 thioredoxin family protein [Calditrichota bacterium]